MELGLNKLPWYGQVGTFLLVALAGFVVFHLYWVVPQQEAMAVRREELALKRIDINRALQTASQLRQFEAEVAELGRRVDSLRAILPEERDASELLRRLQALATQSSLSIRGFTPQAVEPRELYSAWPTRLELVGTYHSLGTFFDRVSKFSQIITISDIEIRAIDPPQLNAAIRASCTATTFVLNDPGVEPASEPSA